jgi:hypothetical protein
MVNKTDLAAPLGLLNITSERELSRSPFLGPLFEGFVASEIATSWCPPAIVRWRC